MRAGPYELLSVLGRGGMGVVHRGRAPDGLDVAVKLLIRVDAPKLARFERERRLLASFTAQDGYVPLLDAGLCDMGPYLVMPFCPGGTLRHRLARGRLGIDETVALGRALAAALGRAHARGIVHRDVKPENILYTADGTPLLTDLGVAKHFDAMQPGGSQSIELTREGVPCGTAGYMAPEQLRDAANAGPPADVFSLGAVLYECLTGTPPFLGESIVDVLEKLARGKFSPLRAERPEVPRWLASVVECALGRSEEARFPDGEAMRAALEPPRTRAGVRPLVALPVVALAALVLVLIARRPRGTGESAVAPVASAAVERPGWMGEPLPRGLERGAASPVCLWHMPDGSTLELVRVPPGDFYMGARDTDTLAQPSEKPGHVHAAPRGYWIGRHDVTWSEYLRFCAATGRSGPPKPHWWDAATYSEETHPVVMVSWLDASAFCAWGGLALPTEAEWEKAARGTDGRRFPWGEDFDPKRCNYLDASCPGETYRINGKTLDQFMASCGGRDKERSDGFPFTSPFGSYPDGASPVGALDMAGNVWQLCEDWFDHDAYARYLGEERPKSTVRRRAIRGGTWFRPWSFCRSSARDSFPPTDHNDRIGFRVVLRESR
ncbi:MAG TPA: bifunctional serine/threonine-protein kinase/formylglycine-generating enzyme family protein [Planctomycetota bacterium]|nr:bifunctional serine/threonine-protein kinase/formylglycine-generating enzyme family protein [Planctomycetota bacterium]